MGPYDPLQASMARYRKRKVLSLYGVTPGLEYNRAHGGYRSPGEECFLGSPAPPGSTEYDPHPGFFDPPRPEYDPPQYAAEQGGHFWTPQPRRFRPQQGPLIEEEPQPTYDDMLRVQAMMDAIQAERELEAAADASPHSSPDTELTDRMTDFKEATPHGDVFSVADDREAALLAEEPLNESASPMDLEQLVASAEMPEPPLPPPAEEDPFEDPLFRQMMDPFGPMPM